MYRSTYYRPARLTVNKASQLRGDKWKSAVLNDDAFAPSEIAGEMEWVPILAKATIADSQDDRIAYINQAITKAARAEDRAFLISILCDFETILTDKLVSDESIDELHNYVMSFKTECEEFGERAYVCSSALLGRNKFVEFEALLDKCLQNVRQANVPSAIDRSVETISNIACLPFLRNVQVNRYELDLALSVNKWKSAYQTIALKYSSNYYIPPVKQYVMDVPQDFAIQLSPRVPHIFGLVLKHALMTNARVLDDAVWLEVLLGNYYPICFGESLLRRLDVDPDRLLDVLSSLPEGALSIEDPFNAAVLHAQHNAQPFLGPEELFEVVYIRARDGLEKYLKK